VQVELPGEKSEGDGRNVMRDDVEGGDATKVTGEATTAKPRRVPFTSIRILRGEGSLPDESSGRMATVGVPKEIDSSVRMDDESTAPGTVADPVLAKIDTDVQSCEPKAINAETITTEKVEVERKRALREIDIAMTMREHLAITNPEMGTAVAFLGAVCGRPTGGRDQQPKAKNVAIVVAMEIGTSMVPLREEPMSESAACRKVGEHG